MDDLLKTGYKMIYMSNTKLLRRWKLYIIFLWLKTKEKEEELQVFIIHQRERRSHGADRYISQPK